MKRIILAVAVMFTGHTFAAQNIAGSDTLAGVMTDAIVELGMQGQIAYVGGGSGEGEKALVNGDQGIAPMSRPLKAEALAALSAKSTSVREIVLGLDGLSMWVKADNRIRSLDIPTITAIYTCQITRWEQIANSGLRGAIKAYRRDDKSGTTDAFKAFTGVKTFGACITEVPTTDDIRDLTSRDVLAIGYAGKSGHDANNKNKALLIAKAAGGTPVAPSDTNVRNGTYPMSRKLFVFEITGATLPSAAEQTLMKSVSYRPFMDKHMRAHDFVTLD